MATRFRLPSDSLLDGNANPLSGGTLEFYVSGTSTPQSVYSDDSLSTPTTNPYSLDAAGRHGDIFLIPADYKVVLKDANGITVKTIDPVHGGSGSFVQTSTGIVYALNPATLGTVAIYGSLAAAQSASGLDAACASLGIPWHLDTNLSLSGDTSFSAKVVASGGKITRGTHALTFAEFSAAPTTQVFDAAGTGLITFTKIDEIFAAWWGLNGDGSTDFTAALTSIFASSVASGTAPINGNRLTTKVTTSLTTSAGMRIRNLYLDHYPANDTTDLFTIVGGDYSPSFDAVRIENSVFRGLQGGATNGRDLIRINRGDHIQIKNVLCNTPKRDGVHIEPDANSHWVENLTMENVKVRTPGRHAFNFYLPDTLTSVFINQTTMIECESRAAVGSALNIQSDSIVASTNKISAFSAINCEFGVNGANATAIVNIQGPASVGSVENIRIVDAAIEDTTNSRTGVGVSISGRCTGSFQLKNSIIFGTSGGRITGHTLFGWYEVDTGSSSDNIFRSHSGIASKYRTASLIQNATENADWILNASEILHVYAGDRFSTWAWRGEWTVYGTAQIAAVGTPANLTMAIVTSGSNKVLQVTNTSVTAVQIEIFIERKVADTAT